MITAIFQTEDGIVATQTTGYTFAQAKPGDTDIHLAAKGKYLVQRRDSFEMYSADGTAPVQEPRGQSDLYQRIFFDALRRFRTRRAADRDGPRLRPRQRADRRDLRGVLTAGRRHWS